MDDLDELQRRLARNPRSATPEECHRAAQREWQRAQAEPSYRARVGVLKRAAFFAQRAVKAGDTDAERLALYVAVLRAASRVHSFPESLRATLAKATSLHLRALGVGEPVVQARARGSIDVESGLVAIGAGPAPPTSASADEADLGSDACDLETATLLRDINEGRLLHVSAQGDGSYAVEIRFVTGAHPLLSASEYRRVVSAADPVVLALPLGRVVVADSGAFLIGCAHADGVGLPIPPGRYLVVAFGLSTPRTDKIVVVLAATDRPARNEVRVIDSVFDG